MARVQAAPDPVGIAPEIKPRDPAYCGIGSHRVLGMRVDATSYAECARTVLEMAEAATGGMTCVATVHMVMEAFDDPDFQRIVNTADRVTPDGMPLVWALRRAGFSEASRVYGPDLTPIVCAGAAERGIPVGFYGGTPEVLERLREVLNARFPQLAIPFMWSPPFRDLDAEEDEHITEAIEASGIGVLFVGLGCPKQERFMAAHRARLSCAQVGVGAAFDFLAGVKSQAPSVLQRAGLEWAFRLATEPRRLWRRYLVGNSRFLFHSLLRGELG